MAERWDVITYLSEARKHADREFQTQDAAARAEWLQSLSTLVIRAHERGDGVAVYENLDLGHPEIGQWQVVSYGDSESQLEVRGWGEAGGLDDESLFVIDGADAVPKTLPDIGGRINWRYQLKAIVPAVK